MDISKYVSKVYAKSSKQILPWRKCDDESYYSSQGLRIKTKDNQHFLITTNHSIPQNTKKTFCWTNVQGEDHVLNKLRLKRRSQMCDLSLLEFGNIRKRLINFNTTALNNNSFLPLKKFSKRIPKVGTKLVVSVKISKNLRPLNLELIFEDLNYSYINGSPNLPLTPILACSFDPNIPYDVLHGLSGSPVFNKNKVVGIISNYQKSSNKIILVPSFLVLKMIFNHLNNIPDNINHLNIPLEETPNGLMISKDCSSKLKKGYIISRINYRILDKDFMIYSPEIKHKLPWKTYLMTNIVNDNVSLYIKAPTITKKSHYYFPIRKKLKNINNFLKVDNNIKNDFVNVSGLVFCELTFPLIKHFYKNNVILKGPSIEKINDNITKTSSKEIVMIDYIGKKTNDIFDGQMSKDLDLEKINIQSVLSLNKLGNKKIKNLNHMKKILEEDNKKIISLEIEKNSFIKINY